MKINTFYNYNHDSISYEHGGGELVTIPDQSLTVKQILERFRRGNLDYDQLKNRGYYDDPDENIDVPLKQFHDLTDVDEVLSNIHQQMSIASQTSPKESKDDS